RCNAAAQDGTDRCCADERGRYSGAPKVQSHPLYRLYDETQPEMVCEDGLGGSAFSLQQRLSTEANLSCRIDVDHLHENLLALFELVADVLDAVRRDFRDVQEAVSPGQYFDERTKVSDALHLSEIGLVQLRCCGQLLDDGNGFVY